MIKFNDTISSIIDKVVTQQRVSKNVIGVFLIGSVARGQADKYSDVDFLVVQRHRSPDLRQQLQIDGYPVEILYNTIDEVERYLLEEHGALHRNTSGMLADARLLYQADDRAQELQTKALANVVSTTRFTETEMLMHRYSLVDFLTDAHREADAHNIIAFHLNAQLLIQNAIEVLLKNHGAYLQQPNRLVTVLQDIDSAFSQLLSEFYGARDLRAADAGLAKIVLHVTRQLGGNLPGAWHVARGAGDELAAAA
ncbi:MAG TPA: nucleotidyltransferase domain-containing protein [Pseudonocardiaceae bacterium]|jgi:predicted nucleotidyltransferase|nr:nucleotidyltransferase domain-containing protein [Pseudonocardiaceae bacterium]